MHRGVVSVHRLLWLEYEVEGWGEEGIRQRFEQYLLGSCPCPHGQESSKL